MYNYIIIIIILLVLLLVNVLKKSENKKMRLIGWGLIIFAIMAYAFSQFGVAFILNPVFSIILIGIIFGIFLVIYKKFRNIKYQKESYEDIVYLNRDISTEYPPSVVGYLINNRLRYKDLIADIMELYAEKIIDISKSNEQGEKKIDFYMQDKEYRSKVKSKSYIYIINTLIDDTKNEKLDFSTWKQLVIEEYEIREFAKSKNDNIWEKVIFIIILCLTAIGGIIGWLIGSKEGVILFPTFLGIMGGAIIGTIVGIQFINFIKSPDNTNVFFSKYGKDELKKWMKFKNFIKDYTLLKERQMEEIAIYESYIPYAIVLDINVQYKNTKFDIFDEEEFQSIMNESDCANFLQSMGINV